MTSYATFLAGKTNIKHGTHEGRPLVLGFMVGWHNEDGGFEILYALKADGTILKTGTIDRPNPNFNKVGRKWTAADAIPDDAEFIGNYPDDMHAAR